MFAIRPYHPSDLGSLYRICLATGDSGQNAQHLYQDPELIGHYYAAPYAILEPDLCFILTYQGQPCGYILGTRDSVEFAQRCESEWFPVLRQRYPLRGEDGSRDAALVRLIHQGHRTLEYPGYPAELHIDLLPIAQGQGWGKQLMAVFLNRLEALGIPGVHLGVGKRNGSAFNFYQRLGFKVLQEYELWWAMGLSLLGKTKPLL